MLSYYSIVFNKLVDVLDKFGKEAFVMRIKVVSTFINNKLAAFSCRIEPNLFRISVVLRPIDK